MKLPVYVVNMKNGCLLGNNFLSALNFEGVFIIFWNSFLEKRKELLLFSDNERD